MCMSVADAPRSRPRPQRRASLRMSSSASPILFSLTFGFSFARRRYSDELRAQDESFSPHPPSVSSTLLQQSYMADNPEELVRIRHLNSPAMGQPVFECRRFRHPATLWHEAPRNARARECSGARRELSWLGAAVPGPRPSSPHPCYRVVTHTTADHDPRRFPPAPECLRGAGRS